LPGAVLIAGLALPATAQVQVSTPIIYSGMCDASAAVALTDKLFAVASDEGSVLRVYPRDGDGAPFKASICRLFSIWTRGSRNPISKAPREWATAPIGSPHTPVTKAARNAGVAIVFLPCKS